VSIQLEITCPATFSSAVAALVQDEDAGRGVVGRR